jgi:hypothetical protein
MKSILTLLAFGAAAAPATAPGNALAFAPASGSSVKRSFSEATAWKLSSIERVLDGQPSPMQAPELEGECRRELVVLDVYAELAGGLPKRLERDFESISGHSVLSIATTAEPEVLEVHLASPHEDAKVTIERKEPSAAPAFRVRGSDAASSPQFAGLREDLDLRALVAEEGVEEGDHWTIDAATLADVFAPGGALDLAPKTGDLPLSAYLEPEDVGGTTLCCLADNAGELSGEVLCTWRSTKKEGEASWAVIELEWDSTTRSDVAPELLRRLVESGDDSMRDQLSMLMSWKSTGQGELTWDLAAHRARSFELKLESVVDVEMRWEEDSSIVGYHFVLQATSELATKIEAR